MDAKEMAAFLATPAAQVALVIGIAEVCKRLGVPARLIPVIDLVLGTVTGLTVYHGGQGVELVASVMIGLAIGLSACGLFSGIKNVAEYARGEEDGGLDGHPF